MGGSDSRALPKTLSRDDVDRLFSMPNLAVPTGLRDRAMMMLMYRCGMRVSETCGLYVRDVKWSDGTIHIRPEIAKGNREAWLYMDDETLAMLQRWKDVRRTIAPGKPHLFVSVRSAQRGQPVTRFGVHEMIQRRAKKAGIEQKVWPHMLRHTYATELLNEGFNIVEVQKLMRHSNIQTTMVYLHIQDNALQAKIRARGKS